MSEQSSESSIADPEYRPGFRGAERKYNGRKRWMHLPMSIVHKMYDLRMRCPICLCEYKNFRSMIIHCKNKHDVSPKSSYFNDPFKLIVDSDDKQEMKDLMERTEATDQDSMETPEEEASTTEEIQTEWDDAACPARRRWLHLPFALVRKLYKCRMKCPKCPKVFKNFHNLRQHYKNKRHMPILYLEKCDPFSLLYDIPDGERLKKAYPDVSYEVPEITEVAEAEESLSPNPSTVKKRTRWTHLPMEIVRQIYACRMKCPLCDDILSSFTSLTNHYSNKHHCVRTALNDCDPFELLVDESDIERLTKLVQGTSTPPTVNVDVNRDSYTEKEFRTVGGTKGRPRTRWLHLSSTLVHKLYAVKMICPLCHKLCNCFHNLRVHYKIHGTPSDLNVANPFDLMTDKEDAMRLQREYGIIKDEIKLEPMEVNENESEISPEISVASHMNSESSLHLEGGLEEEKEEEDIQMVDCQPSVSNEKSPPVIPSPPAPTDPTIGGANCHVCADGPYDDKESYLKHALENHPLDYEWIVDEIESNDQFNDTQKAKHENQTIPLVILPTQEMDAKPILVEQSLPASFALTPPTVSYSAPFSMPQNQTYSSTSTLSMPVMSVAKELPAQVRESTVKLSQPSPSSFINHLSSTVITPSQSVITTNMTPTTVKASDTLFPPSFFIQPPPRPLTSSASLKENTLLPPPTQISPQLTPLSAAFLKSQIPVSQSTNVLPSNLQRFTLNGTQMAGASALNTLPSTSQQHFMTASKPTHPIPTQKTAPKRVYKPRPVVPTAKPPLPKPSFTIDNSEIASTSSMNFPSTSQQEFLKLINSAMPASSLKQLFTPTSFSTSSIRIGQSSNAPITHSAALSTLGNPFITPELNRLTTPIFTPSPHRYPIAPVNAVSLVPTSTGSVATSPALSMQLIPQPSSTVIHSLPSVVTSTPSTSLPSVVYNCFPSFSTPLTMVDISDPIAVVMPSGAIEIVYPITRPIETLLRVHRQ